MALEKPGKLKRNQFSYFVATNPPRAEPSVYMCSVAISNVQS